MKNLKTKLKAIKLPILLWILVAALSACDMTYIDRNNDDSSNEGSRTITEDERDEYEKTGRFLKIINLPLNTQIKNVVSVEVANSASTIASLNENDVIRILKEAGGSCTVYLPLVYEDDNSEFTETGSFFTAFSIHVDAVTSYTVNLSDKLIVSFVEGRGSLDINDLHNENGGGSVITDDEKEEYEKTGRFLKITNLPLNTQIKKYHHSHANQCQYQQQDYLI